MIFIPRIRTLGLTLALGGALSSAYAGPQSNCDRISQDVRESVTKEPSKVLMIVEDSLVINESCACEIIKAAITASHADTPLVKQIVQTAVAVAPKMTPIIIECANAVAPGAVSTADGPAVAKKSGKDAKNVQPEPIMPPKETVVTGGVVGDIRGVYLMAPAVGGFITSTETPPTSKEHRKHTSGRRKHEITPLSPSDSSCDCPTTPDMPGWTP